jgi:hypothetical protein
MVFSILIILLLLVVAFFHFVQGFFSATLSAIIAVLAAAIAVSYDEPVVRLLLKGAMADYAHPLVLCLIFAVVYLLLRVVFDMAIPGNVRTPATIDKVGAALMGIVAGVFVTGIFAIAVQMLPFDPGISFMGYSRYSLHNGARLVTVPTDRQSLDANINNEMEDPVMAPDKQQHLLLPVDDWVLDTVYHLSDNGSLSGDRSLASVHPDYLQEIFGQRAGIQTGARHVALDFSSNPTIDIAGVYTAASLPAKDNMLKALRPPGYTTSPIVKPDADQKILIVRVKVSGAATDDTDSLFRFSTGSIHLVGKTATGDYKDFYPVGTLENQNTVLLDKPDDFLFVKADGAFDAVFVVDSSLVTAGAAADHVAPETFINIKRTASLDLSGQEISKRIPADPSVSVIRNPFLLKELKLPPPSATPAATESPARSAAEPTAAPISAAPVPESTVAASPIAAPMTPPAPQIQPGKELAASVIASLDSTILAPGFNAIGVNTAATSATDAPVAGGTVSFGKSAGAISTAKIDPTATLSQLRDGTTSLTQLYVPENRAAVQVTLHPYTPSWEWMPQLSSIALVDSNGNKYPPNGCYALATVADATGLLLRYDADHTNFDVSTPNAPATGDTYFVFLIPHDTDLKTYTAGGKTQDLDTSLHVQ